MYLLKVWLKRSQNGYTFFVFVFSGGIQFIVQNNRKKKLFFKDMDSYYVMSVKGENYQLDLSILLMQWK